MDSLDSIQIRSVSLARLLPLQTRPSSIRPTQPPINTPSAHSPAHKSSSLIAAPFCCCCCCDFSTTAPCCCCCCPCGAPPFSAPLCTERIATKKSSQCCAYGSFAPPFFSFPGLPIPPGDPGPFAAISEHCPSANRNSPSTN